MEVGRYYEITCFNLMVLQKKKMETEIKIGFLSQQKMRIVSQTFGKKISFPIKHSPVEEIQGASCHLNVIDSSSHFG